MATMRRETKRINRHKLIAIQGWTILIVLLLIASLVGYSIGRFTAPEKIETVTVTETIEIPAYESDKLPEVADVYFFDIPLSESLQRYIYEICADEGVPVTLVMAMITHESNFNPEIVSDTNDYGLMQINEINHDRLVEEYRAADMLNPYQNVFCGVKIVGSYLEEYEGDYHKALMCYNMGEYGAKKLWKGGYDSSSYSRAILELMSEYEQEVSDNAGSNLD